MRRDGRSETDFTNQLLLWEHGHPTAFRAMWFSADAAEYIGPANRGDVIRLKNASRLNRLGSSVEVFDLDLYYPASVYRVIPNRPDTLTQLTSSHETHLA